MTPRTTIPRVPLSCFNSEVQQIPLITVNADLPVPFNCQSQSASPVDASANVKEEEEEEEEEFTFKLHSGSWRDG